MTSPLYAPQPFYAHAHDCRGLFCEGLEQYPGHPSVKLDTAYPNEIQIYHAGSNYQTSDLQWKSQYNTTANPSPPLSSSGSSSSRSSADTASTTSSWKRIAKQIALLEQVLVECAALERHLSSAPALDGIEAAKPAAEQLDDASILAMGFVPLGQWTRDIEEESRRHYEEAFIPHRLRSAYNRPAASRTGDHVSLSAKTVDSAHWQPAQPTPASALAVRRQAPVPLPIDPYCDLLAGAYQETPPCSAASDATARGPLLFAPVSKKRLAKRQNVFLSAAEQAKAACWLPWNECKSTSPKRLQCEGCCQGTNLLVGVHGDEDADETPGRRGRSRTARPIW